MKRSGTKCSINDKHEKNKQSDEESEKREVKTGHRKWDKNMHSIVNEQI